MKKILSLLFSCSVACGMDIERSSLSTFESMINVQPVSGATENVKKSSSSTFESMIGRQAVGGATENDIPSSKSSSAVKTTSSAKKTVKFATIPVSKTTIEFGNRQALLIYALKEGLSQLSIDTICPEGETQYPIEFSLERVLNGSTETTSIKAYKVGTDLSVVNMLNTPTSLSSSSSSSSSAASTTNDSDNSQIKKRKTDNSSSAGSSSSSSSSLKAAKAHQYAKPSSSSSSSSSASTGVLNRVFTNRQDVIVYCSNHFGSTSAGQKELLDYINMQNPSDTGFPLQLTKEPQGEVKISRVVTEN